MKTTPNWMGCQGVGGILGRGVVQTGTGLFGHAVGFIIDQAIQAGLMPDRYKRPVTLKHTKKGKTTVFRSPMFGSSALGGRL